ncbi:hypothetical protein [Streptomyces sp. NPDC056817]|uniref:hypothetical protein n=1 Tax=unclassified Streptomyces TaxID=2593676 RepID=UPI00366731E6
MGQLPAHEREGLRVHTAPEVDHEGLELGEPVGDHPGTLVVADRGNHEGLVVGQALPGILQHRGDARRHGLGVVTAISPV